ncbi:MAG: hypothetical protein O7A63_09485, partial [Acidobacteria bacterium]|nr:hypothetical protein [Acidobacteriota bacterium]
VKEKILAARRAQIDTIILPEPNRRNLEEVPKLIRKGLRFVFVSDVSEVFDIALADPVSRRAGPRMSTGRPVAAV